MYDSIQQLHPHLLEIIKNTTEDRIAGSLAYFEQMADENVFAT